MRPPVLLLLLAATGAAPPRPAPSYVLLVLRSACGARDPSLFSASKLHSYALAVNRSVSWRDFRVLSYNETCGGNWRLATTLGSLHALQDGGAVAFVGRADAGMCGALRALRLPAPAACAAPSARAVALRELAARLRWRTVLLPPHGTCDRVMPALALELASAGFYIRRKTPSLDELDLHPHVLIVCSWGEAGVRWLPGGARALAVLLVQLAPEDADLQPAATRAPDDAHAWLPLRNQNFSSALELLLSNTSNLSQLRNLSNNFNSTHELLSPSSARSHDSSQISLSKIKTEKLKENEVASNFNYAKKGVIKKRQSSPRRRRYANSFRQRRDIRAEWSSSAFGVRPLILSDEPLEQNPRSYLTNIVFNEVLDAIERHAETERTNTETARNTYFLYESPADLGRRWVPLVALSTVSVRALHGDADWHTVVDVVDPGGEFRRWSSALLERRGSAGGWHLPGAAGALSACGLLAASMAAALACRRTRRRRRPRAAPVLAEGDFSFPVDERRLGDGMENMVSWLQQLHGCAAAELERPDLLRRTAPPSAPSSTCSITRLAPDRRVRYKGDPVHIKHLPAASALDLRRKAVDVLLVMQSLRQENINPFIGCLCEARPALVFAACGRGSLEDVLMADDIPLDWTFRLSLLTDLARGMRYLHASPLRVHGRLTSRNCVVDSRWVLRVSDYGVPAFARTQLLPLPQRSARELLWTAPELLRAGGAAGGSAAGDVFSFGIIMQEVIVRGEPYCMLPLAPEEIVEKLSRPPPLVRPSVSLGLAPPDAVGVMRQCWSEAPDLRPDFARVCDTLRHMHCGRKINIIDSMFEMLEKYSNNLEELIKERTEQLDMEKKKTEQLLNRMLPRSVAERLMLGSRVQPEEFEEVSIYFSDIVGFTELAARSTPVQVVDLLNDLYTTFDAAIEQYSVYKVETIGDAYMVVGGLPTRTCDHAESVATMALHLLHLAGRFRVRHLPATPLHLRIGLHTGPCCAAVVGLTMPRYCLFGDTVNTASRMESTGAAWRIQVSAATAERLTAAGGYRLRSRGLRQIKGKGAMHTYWLLGKEGFEKPLPTPPPLESEEVLFESDGENDSERSSAESAPRAPHAPSAADDCLAGSARLERVAWARSGAVSADSSPPRLALGAHSRYRCLAGSARALRRQWSLERGDVLAAEAARSAEPLALRPPPPRTLARYRTRPST